MDQAVLRAYVRRCRAVTDASPPRTVAETCRWLVEPLLAALGWTPRRAGPAWDVEYVCSVEGVPALLVAVEAHPDPLDAERSDRLRATMARTVVDRAIYTNGADLALYTDPDGDPTPLTLEALTDGADALDAFEQGRTRRRLAESPDLRAARRLADGREELTARIADALVDRAGEDHRQELRFATDRFLDRLIDVLAEPRERRGSRVARSDPDDGLDDGPSDSRSEGDPSGRRSEGDPSDSETEGDPSDGRDRSDDGSGRLADEERPRASTDRSDDGEYVVRFFADRGSIGAVGHSDSGEAAVQAAEFLLERGLSGVSPPWPDDGPILLESPEAGDAPRELSNGLVLDVGQDATERGRRVVALAERAGLRAMLTGDWG